MLFACLHGKHEGALAVGIDGLSHQSSGHFAHQCVLHAEIADVGASARQGQAQALCIAAGNVGSPFARSAQHGQTRSHRVDGQQGLVGVAFVGQTAKVLHDSIVVGLCHNHAGHVLFGQQAAHFGTVGRSTCGGNLHQVYTMELGIGFHHGTHGGVDGSRDEHAVALLGGSHTHHHGFGGSRRTVIHGSVREVHAGEVGHHGLVFEDILQCALRYFGLVGSVRG